MRKDRTDGGQRPRRPGNRPRGAGRRSGWGGWIVGLVVVAAGAGLVWRFAMTEEPVGGVTPVAGPDAPPPTEDGSRKGAEAESAKPVPGPAPKEVARRRALVEALRASPAAATKLEFPPLPKPPTEEIDWGAEFKARHPVLTHEIKDSDVKEGISIAKRFTPAQLEEMAPRQVPGHRCKCPRCGKGPGKNDPWDRQWRWDAGKPDVLFCSGCKTAYPNAEYPMSRSKGFWNPAGEKITLHYYRNAKGEDFYLDGQLDSVKNKGLLHMLDKLAKAYHKTGDERCARAAIGILKGYAHSFPHWLTRTWGKYLSTGGPWMRNGKPVSRKGWSPFGWKDTRNDNYGSWWFNSFPRGMLASYDLVYKYPALDSEEGPDGGSLRFWIEKSIFDDQAEFILMYTWPNQIKNNLASQIGHLVSAAMVMGRPDYARFARQWCRLLFYNYDNGHDMVTTEGPGYHSTWILAIRGNYRTAAIYEDPPGYKDADGVHLTGSDPREFPAKRRQVLGHSMMAYPDGTRYPIGDSPRNALWAHPLRRSVNRIAPGFGLSILGDGQGPPEEQVQAILTWSGGNHAHCHEDALSLLLFAHGHELFSDTGGFWDAHASWHHNCVVVDRELHQKIKSGTPHGDLELHAPHLPGVAISRVDGRGCSYPDATKRYRRTLMHNTVNIAHPYVIDVFEVEGGSLHEYHLQGSLEAKRWKADKNPVIEHYQVGSCSLSGFKDYTDHSGALPKEWKGFHDLRSAPMGRDGFVDFRFNDLPDVGTRTHFQKDPSTTLVLGKAMNFRFGKVSYGKNKIEEMPEGATVPKLILQRRGSKGFSSVFVLLHEPIKGESVVKRFSHTVSREGVLSVEVEFKDGRKDYHAIALEKSGKLKSGPLTGKGTFAAAVTRDGKCDLWMAGATEAACMGRAVKSARAAYTGKVLKITREETGAPRDAYLTDAPIPVDRAWKNEIVLLEFHDEAGDFAFTQASEIIEVLPDGDMRWVTVRQDAGVIQKEDGTWEELFYPHRKAASCRLKVVTSTTTVPAVSVSPGKGRYGPEWVNDYTPLDAGEKITVSTRFARVPVEVSGDAVAEGVGDVDVELTKLDGTLTVRALNPGGVMQPAPEVARFLRPLPALDVPREGLEPGVRWTLYHGHADTKDVSELKKREEGVAETIERQKVVRRSYSSVFEGLVEAPDSGRYTFHTRAEGGTLLFIDGKRIMETVGRDDDMEWDASLYLAKGLHRIRYVFTYYRWGTSLFTLRWSGPGFEKRVMPRDSLFHGPPESP